MGKVAIAATLIPCETPDAMRKARGIGWAGYLLDNMIAGSKPSAFQLNQLSVITFNFDRSFDRLLYRAVQSSYGLDGTATAELIEQFPSTTSTAISENQPGCILMTRPPVITPGM